MHIIIDGYNLIRHSPALSAQEGISLESGRRALLLALQSYQRRKGYPITVVFDGGRAPPSSVASLSHGGVSTIFSPPGQTADQVIVSMSRPGVVVVSSDRELARSIEDLGADCVPAEAFLGKLEQARRPSHLLPEDEPLAARRKGTSRRLPKAERRRADILRRL